MIWAIEWLYHYELWLITGGEWLGGGTVHGATKKILLKMKQKTQYKQTSIGLIPADWEVKKLGN